MLQIQNYYEDPGKSDSTEILGVPSKLRFDTVSINITMIIYCIPELTKGKKKCWQELDANAPIRIAIFVNPVTRNEN